MSSENSCCQISLTAYMTFYSNVQSKMYNGLQFFFVFLFFSCWGMFLLSLYWPWSIHPFCFWQCCLYCQPALTLLITCLVRTHLQFIIPWKKCNGDEELNFKYSCRPGQEMTTWCFVYQNWEEGGFLKRYKQKEFTEWMWLLFSP